MLIAWRTCTLPSGPDIFPSRSKSDRPAQLSCSGYTVKPAFWIWGIVVSSNVLAALTWPPSMASRMVVWVVYTFMTTLE